MARRRTFRSRAREEQSHTQTLGKAVAAVLIGLALLMAPSFIGNPILKAALTPLRAIGWFMLIGGGAIALLGFLTSKRQTGSGYDASLSKGRDLDSGPSGPMPPRFNRVLTDTDEAKAFNPARSATVKVGTEAPGRVSPRVNGMLRDTVEAKAFYAARSATVEVDIEAPGRPMEWSSSVFDLIEWRRFEALCERLFAQAGFETKSQSHGADEGIDIWLFSKTQPDTAVSLVQCKCWTTRPVKVAEVRALLGSMAAKKVQRGVFATTSRFSADAAQFCKDNGIHALDRTGLLGLIGQRTAEQQRELLAVATEGKFWVPTCASCGIKMVRRPPKAARSGFWGCLNYPRCRTVING